MEQDAPVVIVDLFDGASEPGDDLANSERVRFTYDPDPRSFSERAPSAESVTESLRLERGSDGQSTVLLWNGTPVAKLQGISDPSVLSDYSRWIRNFQ